MIKNEFCTIILGLITSTVAAQVNDYPTSGNPTIYSYSPEVILKRNINGGGFTQGIQTQLLDGTNNWFFGNLHEQQWIVSKGDFQDPKLTILNNGNIGIGNSIPNYKLDINKPGVGSALNIVGSAVGTRSDTGIDFSATNSVTVAYARLGLQISTGTLNQETGGLTFSTISGGILSEKMFIKGDGNVGIGITNPSEKLAVNGTIRAKEIKVENTNWPDYVFSKYYPIPTLKETEKHIKEKGHLPGIPSAEEVRANGINLGEMNAKLLQKIEELTLHLIKKDKKDSAQQTEIDKLKKQIELILRKENKKSKYR